MESISHKTEVGNVEYVIKTTGRLFLWQRREVNCQKDELLEIRPASPLPVLDIQHISSGKCKQNSVHRITESIHVLLR